MRMFYLKSSMPIFPVDISSDEGYAMQVQCDEIGDEYHTMHELYQHRMALNIVLFNRWASDWEAYHHVPGILDLNNASPEVMKSKLHHDGTMFDGYFIVMAITPNGQISYHYELKHWDKFKIPEVERTPEYDGHDSLQVIERLMKL
jgi:hypothetical protein